MDRIRRAPGTAGIVFSLFMTGLLVAAVACASSPDAINPPPVHDAGKGNPKLDSFLNELVNAEKRGEVHLFAEQNSGVLVDDSVRVIVECVPGRIEAARQAATEASAKIEGSYANLLQVVVPISSVSTLAGAESVRFVRLPQRPLPAIGPGEIEGSWQEGGLR